jgi:hypothetical protein
MTKSRNKSSGMSLKLEPELFADISRTAKARGISASEVVRNLVVAGLDVCPVCKSALKRRHGRAQAAA